MKTYAMVVKDDQISKQISNTIKEKIKDVLVYDKNDPDLVISVGGDGTMLASIHQYLHHDTMFVGVHTGTLGFFTDYQSNEIDALMEDIKQEKYRILKRHVLQIDVCHKQGMETYYALNEMRIDHDFTTQVIDIYINDELLEVFRGNGICVSTSSGSTAYNKSLGGAVIYSSHPLMQLTEVAGIQHNAYRCLGSSLILDDRQVIKLVGRNFHKVFLGIDHLSYDIEDVEKIEVSISSKVLKFVEFKEMSFIKRIRRAFISE